MEFTWPESLTVTHIFLAYAGMVLHLFLKMAKASKNPDFTFGRFFSRSEIIKIVTSVLMIPLILFMACDPVLKDTLPINNVTAVFAGWQTNSIFRNLMGMYKKKPASSTDE